MAYSVQVPSLGLPSQFKISENIVTHLLFHPPTLFINRRCCQCAFTDVSFNVKKLNRVEILHVAYQNVWATYWPIHILKPASGYAPQVMKVLTRGNLLYLWYNFVYLLLFLNLFQWLRCNITINKLTINSSVVV